YGFYEVKFRKKQVSNEVIDEEISQVEATGLNCYKYVFFSRSGFNCNCRDNVRLINLSDIFVGE
ncbi:MAG: ATP-binding protein, partial [Clostridia bacterium]|nr:ATP-binding protein [Clostridia bacterium]